MGKCEFWNKCKLYDKEAVTCNFNNGDYGDRDASCKRRLKEKKK